MKFVVRTGFERPFLELGVEGELTVGSSMDRIGRLRENEHYRSGMNLLFDLRAAELHTLDLDYMSELRQSQSAMPAPDAGNGKGEGRRVAFLVATESDELVMKLYKETLDLSAAAPKRERRVFKDYDEAAAWLGGKEL